jgi:hypothetical protein
VDKPPIFGGSFVETQKFACNFTSEREIFLFGYDKTVVVEIFDAMSVEYFHDLSKPVCGEKSVLSLFHRAVESLSTVSAGPAGSKNGEFSRF